MNVTKKTMTMLLIAILVTSTLAVATVSAATVEYNVTITDDNNNWGSRDNEAVGIPITSGLTLDELFAGDGLMYNYTVLDVGTVYNGDAPVIAVIDLEDGRHIILFPGWGARAENASFTLQFSETVAHDSGGNNYVDFSLQPANFSSWLYGSGSTYGDFEFVKANTELLNGSEVVTRIAIQHQAANTGQKDRLDSLTFVGLEPEPEPKPVRKPRRGGVVSYGDLQGFEMVFTLHKLIAVAPLDSDVNYNVTVTVLSQYGVVLFHRTYLMRASHTYLAVYLRETSFPDNYVVVVSSSIGYVPYVVASRSGIERSG